MTKEEIRRLLGGYATNTLTESERSALFEAALDDQELFDALQQEQALKNVLDNPAARAEIQQALERRVNVRSRWWIWGSAFGAAAAVAVLIAVFFPRSTVVFEKRTEIASPEKPAGAIPPSASAPAPASSSPSVLRSEPPSAAIRADAQRQAAPIAAPRPSAAPVPAPPAVIPPPVVAQEVAPSQQQGPGGVALSQGIQTRDQVSGSLARNSFTALSSAASLQTASLRYSLVKQEPGRKDVMPAAPSSLKNGDLVRIRVSAPSTGRVVLSRLDPAGSWQPMGSVAPEPNSISLLPSDPIVVTESVQRFQLTFEPVAPQAKAARTVGQIQAPAAPSPVEIAIVAAAR